MRIAVVGGTGVVGRHTVRAAQEAGHEAVPLSRASGVDLGTGSGLAAALEGVDAVIDTSNIATSRASTAIDWFGRAATNLLAAARTAQVRHVVALSIVGIDRVGLGYYKGKLRQEEVLLTPGAGVPVSVVRATQFHEFGAQALQRLPSAPLVVVPTMRCQPIAAREVGAALVERAAGDPVGRAPDLAGPRTEYLASMIRRYLRATGSRKPVLQVPVPIGAGRAAASGGLQPETDGPRGTQTYDEWLAGPDVPRA